MVKHALYNPDTDGDGFQEAPAQLKLVQPGDVVIGPAGTYVPAANLPNFIGFVDQTGAPWPA